MTDPNHLQAEEAVARAVQPGGNEHEAGGNAAEYADADVQYALGVAYVKGDGVKQDHAEAFKWLRKAAARGHVKAQLLVGWHYRFGTGTAKDNLEALVWFSLAADPGGSADAARQRDNLARELGPENAALAQKRCQELQHEIAAREGSTLRDHVHEHALAVA